MNEEIRSGCSGATLAWGPYKKAICLFKLKFDTRPTHHTSHKTKIGVCPPEVSSCHVSGPSTSVHFVTSASALDDAWPPYQSLFDGRRCLPVGFGSFYFKPHILTVDCIPCNGVPHTLPFF